MNTRPWLGAAAPRSPDAAGVEVVGQGFCDEVLRVFAAAHAAMRLEPVRMNDMVAFMVDRARAAASAT